ncbi:DUF2065 domain-containing protein [Blastochloris sulfoviridis]|uniref:DUF2065 domain-containing protein n=1 Tax=Blastochloris sulfoviridis TaxID=50712 RepID=A0A5M6I4P2_9HYPH|nr:DUF2065 domain-containing protein [Blastochloris sulfoviridis]KAA5603196.1 DUF2065 domain-containing protein [Blastochloris sulfoviridis]
MADFIVAFGLLLAMEGLLYAAAPDLARRAVVSILQTPDPVLRVGGLVAAIAGVVLIWMVRG